MSLNCKKTKGETTRYEAENPTVRRTVRSAAEQMRTHLSKRALSALYSLQAVLEASNTRKYYFCAKKV